MERGDIHDEQNHGTVDSLKQHHFYHGDPGHVLVPWTGTNGPDWRMVCLYNGRVMGDGDHKQGKSEKRGGKAL